MPDYSIETVKRNVGLAYGDIALMGQQIIRCIEFELAQRDARIAELEGRIAFLEDQ